MKKQPIKLTAREKSELIAEGFVTVVLLLLLDLSLIMLIELAILNNQSLEESIYFIKSTMTIGKSMHLWSWQGIFIGFLAIIDVIVLAWRLVRRYHQIQLRHVIRRLHYIAEGHFNQRINFYVRPDLQKVIDSINALVDSTVQAMDDERKIERSKDELITNVSHDIRTPLTSIIGYLGLLQNKAFHSEEEHDKYVEIAFVKSKQLKSLADDLFEYTKLQSTKMRLQPQKLHLFSMLEQVAASFELEAEKKGMQINVDCKPEDLAIEADPEKLVRVYNNLISNALKYGHGASEINLSAQQLNDQRVELRVENNGEPIPADSLQQIFERFYRVENSRNKATGGTGLGLAITKSIVELHHGTIRCESDQKLTSFIINLPLKVS
ncbi:MAG: HAMP domain-containing histidine kinase [Lactobacillus sp.]|jgi:signal transduction histidine kinase|nr:HAMP domain-containing histidine kinase [Lactobacillus sp.]MCH3905593.1 HAMP domain-containing histidine kinase [Lactobacillus sp.]MCH3990848.1 HAMP domain-containing histidine kinase [Lactobacillus sp.]MCH4068436.1 HAMP domain-containing histidine kinase [Lactobacillus sp.]MCI1304185.1 HAMP domain-containing histidine kinase [Lactobacillus sp.]